MSSDSKHRLAVALPSALLRRTEFTELGVPQLQRLSNRLWARFERTCERIDLEDALKADRRIVELTRDDDPKLPERLNGLSTSLLTRFSQYSEPDDIDCAVDADQRAVELTLDGDPMRPPRESNLALSLKTRFDRLGDVGDLERAIDAHRRAVAATPNDDARLPFRLNNLAACLRCRFTLSKHSAAVIDIDEAVDADRRAVALLAPDHPDLPLRLDNLTVSFITRFDHFGQLIDLESAVEAGVRAAKLEDTRHALAIVPYTPPGRLMRLNNLAVALLRRFHVCHEKDDLKEALLTWNKASELEFNFGDNSHGRWAFRQAICHLLSYEHYGAPHSLTAALREFRRAVAAVDEDDVRPEISARMNGIATCLLARFEHYRDPDDLDAALQADRLAIAFAPDDPVQLTNLATSLYIRFRHLGDADDLAQALTTDRRAVALSQDWDPALPSRLSNLACSLRAQYHVSGSAEPADIEDALTADRRAVELASGRRPTLLVNLAASLIARFVRFGDRRDIEDAEDVARRALALVPEGHPQRARMLYSLSLVLTTRSATCRTQQDFDVITALHKRIFEPPPQEYYILRKGLHLETSVLPMDRLHYAQTHVRFLTDTANAEFCGPDSEALLVAYSRLMNVIPELVWHGHSLQRQITEAGRARAIVSAAVHAALGAGNAVKAMEWLEAGQSIIWTQILSVYRLPAELQERHNELVLQLYLLQSRFWEMRGWLLADELDDLKRKTDVYGDSFAESYRQKAMEYDDMIRAVRDHEGFEDYMRPVQTLASFTSSPAFARLQAPVVFLTSCDALILLPGGAVKHVPLPQLSNSKAERLRVTWTTLVHSRAPQRRGGELPTSSVLRASSRNSSGALSRRVLGLLWIWIVQPVLEALDFIKPAEETNNGTLPHIIWCPTGPFTQLPLHAAGIYGSKTGGPPQHAFDFAVSSYTQSLSALMRCLDPSRSKEHESERPTMLLVAQRVPARPGLSSLPCVREESDCIRAVMQMSGGQFFYLKEEGATVEDTLECLRDESVQWVHFACHGSQGRPGAPMLSAFELHDRSLTLADLMRRNPEKEPELAFLSACETAVGDESIPEESLHLAAGLLAVGFKGIIATMWSIQDADAPIIVEAYYRRLLELRTGDGTCVHTGAADALHYTVELLRDKVGEEAFERWVPFVHFGV
ncbi:unnamed protein product [Peniophora sp. CBMAI 1063]|nr:unnamed protein product [Peniophora sp. CBMAI 1063]